MSPRKVSRSAASSSLRASPENRSRGRITMTVAPSPSGSGRSATRTSAVWYDVSTVRMSCPTCSAEARNNSSLGRELKMVMVSL